MWMYTSNCSVCGKGIGIVPASGAATVNSCDEMSSWTWQVVLEDEEYAYGK